MGSQDSGETAGPATGTDDTTRGGRRAGRSGRVRRDERGIVLVWTTLFLLVLLAFAALAVDLGHSYYVGEREQDAADAAALAGAPYLPSDLAAAQGAAREVAASNGFKDGVDGVTVDPEQDPGDPSQLVVTIHQNVGTWFAGAIGFHTMDVAKSATGIASQPNKTPVDMMLILDRTQSMTAQDLQDVKDAAGALLQTLDPTADSVALGVTGPSLTTQQCGTGGYGVGTKTMTLDMATMTWIAAPWPNAAPVTDYLNADGSLNVNSQLVKTINCLDTSRSNTNLGDPVIAAKSYFATYGRPGAQKDIILLTDGAANKPDGTNPCQYASNDATVTKSADVTIVTIGFGLDDLSDPGNHCVKDTSGPFVGAFATKLLADMASPINGVAAVDDGCTEAENTDGDNFFCEPKSGDLTSVFLRAGQQLTASDPRLVH